MGILTIHSILTIVGASFRNTGEILELAGCDYLTISPALLDELQKTDGAVPKKLDANKARDLKTKKVSFIDNEPDFRFHFNEDQMATEKLSDGIRYASFPSFWRLANRISGNLRRMLLLSRVS